MSEQKRSAPSLQSLAAFSHEFRTPLNGVLGMAQLLESTRLTAEQRAYVAVLRQSGDHLLSLVNDLLDLAKLETGAVTLSPAPLEPAALLQSVCELLSPRAYAKGLEIAWATPAGIPAINADESRLRQVVLNLAGNAIKFTETGGAMLTCALMGPGRGSKVKLRFSVEDTGPGVAPEDRDRIFEAFAQSHDHITRTDSTGLGLAVVKRLADAHGGRVGVDSAPGKGATFWFEAEFERAGAAAPATQLKGATVIVATPNPVMAHAAAAQIKAKGGSAIVCVDLASAEAVAGPDRVAIIDHALAKNGNLKPLKKSPCLVMLAPEQRAAIGAHRAAGFAGYLVKPLRAASLVERVQAVMGYAGGAPAKDERAVTETAPGARVLLVEDHPVNALLARKLLEREGCSVDWVTTGEMALSAAKAGHDLILMDRRLPGMDGVATTKALREAGVIAPIVALTADAFDEDRKLCLDAGMDDFLVKPLEPASLRAVLSRALSGGWTKAKTDAKLAS